MNTTHAKTLLVAIDGPAGSGKSSVSREVAKRLNFGILDTGAAYRALTWRAVDLKLDLDDAAALQKLLDSWNFSITLQGVQAVKVDGIDVTKEIRDPVLSAQISRVSKHDAVRQALNEMFLQIVAGSKLEGVVIEGRDITTVVAPHAPVRILMTASAEVRALRRAKELPGSTVAEVQKAIEERDAKDQKVVDFMNPAPGVTLIDTSELDFEAAIDAVLKQIEAVK